MLPKRSHIRLLIKMQLAQATREDGNPAMDGWLLEMWVFARLRKGGITLCSPDGSVCEVWDGVSTINSFDLSNVPHIPDTATWWKPIKWNQGGYDVIFTDKRQRKLTIVQVTSGESYSFTIRCFHELLSAIFSSYDIEFLEIFFLVEKSKLDTFKISELTGEGPLAERGWPKNKELGLMKVLGIDGVRKC